MISPAADIIAKPVEGIITDVIIENDQGQELETATEWEYIYVHMKWAIPDGTVKKGDEMTIKLPDELRFSEDIEFDVLDSEGNVVARAYCNAQDKTVKLVFTDYAETRKGVHGDLWFATMIERSEVENGDKIRPEFIIDGETFPGNEFEFVEEKVDEEALINKYGVFGEDKTRIEYNIRVGMANKEVKGVEVKDRLGTAGVTYDKGSFKVFEASWKVSDTGGWTSEEFHLVPSIQPVFDADDRGFTIDLGDIAAHEGYLIQYWVDIDHEAAPGEMFENSADLISDGEEVDYETAYTQHQSGGGSGEGGNEVPTPTPTPTPSATPTPTPSVTPTPTPTATPTPTPTVTPTATPTPKPTEESDHKPSKTPTPDPKPSGMPKPTATPTKTPDVGNGSYQSAQQQGGNISLPKSTVLTSETAKTADANEIIPVVIALILSIVGIAYAIVARRREQKNKRK